MTIPQAKTHLPAYATSGFTLVEIMMVILMIGMVSTMVTISLVPQINHAYADQTSSRLGFTFQEAQALAVSENRPVEVSLNPSENTLVIWQDLDLDGERDLAEEESMLITEHESVRVEADWSAGRFLPSGVFVVLPLTRSLYSVETVITSADGDRQVVKVFGSGAVTME